jgi:hypothetical protein
MLMTAPWRTALLGPLTVPAMDPRVCAPAWSAEAQRNKATAAKHARRRGRIARVVIGFSLKSFSSVLFFVEGHGTLPGIGSGVRAAV